MTTPQAGWYPDPSGDATKLRYWDGAQWTEYYAAAQPASQAAGANHQDGQSGQTAPGSAATGTAYSAPGGPASPYAPYAPAPDNTDSMLRLVAFIFAVLGTVSVGWLLIPLAWMIPMTVHAWGIYKGTKANTVAFGVCSLIFLNLVAGILLLVSKKDA